MDERVHRPGPSAIDLIDAPLQDPRVGQSAGRDSVVRVRGVSKVFAAREIHALDPVDLDLHEGRFTSIIGPSGCGKSTLIKIMGGLLPATTGSVTIQGSPVVGPRRDIGMMFQQAILLPWRTAQDNVLLPIEVRDGSAASRARAADARALLATVGLTGFETLHPHELSGGMAQRVAICRMLITEPSVLLLDEPFGALDELTRERMNLELQRVCQARQATTVMVTHSIPEAVFLADTVYVMSQRPGRIAGSVEVDFPRPRSLDLMSEARFGELVRDVRSMLDLGSQL